MSKVETIGLPNRGPALHAATCGMHLSHRHHVAQAVSGRAKPTPAPIAPEATHHTGSRHTRPPMHAGVHAGSWDAPTPPLQTGRLVRVSYAALKGVPTTAVQKTRTARWISEVSAICMVQYRTRNLEQKWLEREKERQRDTETEERR